MGESYLNLIRIALCPEAVGFIHGHGTMVLGKDIVRIESINQYDRRVNIHVVFGGRNEEHIDFLKKQVILKLITS